MNPEIVKCPCGKASMTYEIVGEDQWFAAAVNTEIHKEGYGMECICKSCHEEYDRFDPCMVKILEQ